MSQSGSVVANGGRGLDATQSKQAGRGLPKKDGANPGAAKAKRADQLLAQADKLGRTSDAAKDIEGAKAAFKLLAQAVATAPDYPKVWETYRLALNELSGRFGHSLILSDAQITAELARCEHALTRLSR